MVESRREDTNKLSSFVAAHLTLFFSDTLLHTQLRRRRLTRLARCTTTLRPSLLPFGTTVIYSKRFRPRGRAFWSSQLLVCLCVSFLTVLSWYTGADFAGQASAGWSSGAKSLTSAGVASAFNEAKDNGDPAPSWGKGMFGKYLIADPSYSGADGGFGGNASFYPLDGNYVVPMCGSSVCVCALSGRVSACLSPDQLGRTAAWKGPDPAACHPKFQTVLRTHFSDCFWAFRNLGFSNLKQFCERLEARSANFTESAFSGFLRQFVCACKRSANSKFFGCLKYSGTETEERSLTSGRGLSHDIGVGLPALGSFPQTLNPKP